MTGAIFALTANMVVALLFAATYLVLSASKVARRGIRWFAASYIIGAATPASEFLVRATSYPEIFVATSFASFSLSFHVMAHGLAVYYGTALPRWLLPASFVLSLVVRAAIWGGPRNTMPYELIYQVPFAWGVGLCAVVIARAAWRRPIGRLLVAMFTVLSLHFFVKPFVAVALGTGATAKDYVASPYAMFSQAMSGILLIGTGLALLLVVVHDMLDAVRLDADVDGLSGLSNRRAFDRDAAAVLGAAHAGGRACAALLFDLDRFKAVNDDHGHAAGDAVIRAFARALEAVLPAGAITGRTGGEEFAALLPGRSAAEALAAAEAVRAAVEALRFPEVDAALRVTVSGGVAAAAPGEDLPALMVRADRALYAAKAAGRNRIVAAA